MNIIKNYEITFIKSGEYRSNIVETAISIEEIKNWYLLNYKADIILGIHEFLDIPKKSQTLIRL